ncbi:rCG49476 [Rattus norvegicus]|uniref:RCG49476 n=1 Tax=Rattus norvegicus TaxID=10116 RepID=A6J2I7_RAT|nr:rCG49476 [Rattus norvegicus]
METNCGTPSFSPQRAG